MNALWIVLIVVLAVLLAMAIIYAKVKGGGKSQPIQIYVQKANGEPKSVTISPSATINDLIIKINAQNILGSSVDTMVWKGDKLPLRVNLTTIGIKEGDVIVAKTPAALKAPVLEAPHFPKDTDKLIDFSIHKENTSNGDLWLYLMISNVNKVCDPILLHALEKCNERKKLYEFIRGSGQGVAKYDHNDLCQSGSKDIEIDRDCDNFIKEYSTKEFSGRTTRLLQNDYYIIDSNLKSNCEHGCKLPLHQNCYCIDMVLWEISRTDDSLDTFPSPAPPGIVGISFMYSNGFRIEVNFVYRSTTWIGVDGKEYIFGPHHNPYITGLSKGKKGNMYKSIGNASKDIYIVAAAVAWRIYFRDNGQQNKYVHLVTNDCLTKLLGLSFGLSCLMCQNQNKIPQNPKLCEFLLPKNPILQPPPPSEVDRE